MYITKTDLEARYGASEINNLIDRDNNGTEDVGVLNTLIADTDNQIDGYLAARYVVPLTTTPDIIKRVACDIARYWLWKDRASELVRKNFEDAISTLNKIGSGKILLSIEGVAAAVTATSQAQIRTLIFTDELLARQPSWLQ